MPKTNGDAIFASPCRHRTSFCPTKWRYCLTRLEVHADGTQQQLSTRKTRPRLRPFAQSATELMESLTRHESIVQWFYHQWLKESRKSRIPP